MKLTPTTTRAAGTIACLAVASVTAAFTTHERELVQRQNTVCESTGITKEQKTLRRALGNLLKEETNQGKETEQEILVEEDFALFTEGSEDNPQGIDDCISSAYDIDTKYFKNGTKGWVGIGVTQAGGCCHLLPEYNCMIQTPQMDMSGTMTIKFRAKSSQNYNKPMLAVSICNGSDEAPDIIKSFKATLKNDEWTEFSFTFRNTYGGKDCMVQFYNMRYGVLIDDIEISVLHDLLAYPIALPASDFTYDGFTANWEEVARADQHLLSVFRYKEIPGAEEKEFFQFFNGLHNTNGTLNDNARIPTGWTLDLGEEKQVYDAIFDPEAVAVGNYSLRFDSKTDTIVMPDNGCKLASLKFDARSLGGLVEIPGYGWFGGGSVRFAGWDGYRWVKPSVSWQVDKPDGFKTIDMTEDVAGKYYTVKIYVTGFTDSLDGEPVEVAIDNFEWTTMPEEECEYALKDEPVEGGRKVLTGLDPYADYYYTVKCRNTVNGMESGAPQSCIDAFGVSAPVVREPSDIDRRGSYTANWDETPKATAYEVNHLEVYKAPTAVEAYPVLKQDFSNIQTSATVKNPVAMYTNVKLESLDDSGFTDRLGWYGYLWGIANGALGVVGVPDYGLGGELQTPELSLANNGGKCHVKITVYGPNGDYLYVVNRLGGGLLIQLSGEFETYEGDIEGCGDKEIIALYTQKAGDFFIRDIEITQNLEAGDEVVELIDLPETDINSYRFQGLSKNENKNYAYEVYAIYRRINGTRYSDCSERMSVEFEQNNVETISESSDTKIGTVHNAIAVLLNEEQMIEVYDLSGRLVASANGIAGLNIIETDANGLYIVKAGKATAKVMIR